MVHKFPAGHYCGSSMHSDWNPFTEGYLFKGLLAEIGHLNIDLEKQNLTPNYKVMLWSQGESDTASKYSKDYAPRLTELVRQVREKSGNPQMPVLVSRLKEPGKHNQNDLEKFKQQQDTFATNDPYARVVETSSLSQKPDQVHFDTQGQLGLGAAFYETYKNANWTSSSQSQTSIRLGPSPLLSGNALHVWVTSSTYCPRTQLKIINVIGQELTQFAEAPFEPGEHEFVFTPQSFNKFSTGIYFAVMDFFDCQGLNQKRGHLESFKFEVLR